MCQIRSFGLQSSALYHAPPAVEQADCSSECTTGNGASCYRLARLFARPHRQLDGDAAKACRSHYAQRACRLGLPQGCDHPTSQRDSDLAANRQAAFARLKKRCDPAVATWACFYVAHNTAMAWGTGLGSKETTQALYDRVCAARCPDPPERCYRQAACGRATQACK